MRKYIRPLALLLLVILLGLGCTTTAGQQYYSDSDPGEPLFDGRGIWPSPHGF